jgi:glycosyltransferase involved in cell wall biosynthesis
MKKKIIFIGFNKSIHTTRWINQLVLTNYKIYLIPSFFNLEKNSILSDKIIQILPFPLNYFSKISTSKHKLLKIIFHLASLFGNILYNKSRYKFFVYKNIKKIKPDLIHSLETQSAGYLVLDIKKKYYSNSKFPTWWHTNWGSDFYLFSNFKNHNIKIKDLLNNIDYYSCESIRDKLIAEKLGYKGITLSTYPNTGGFDLNLLEQLKNNIQLIPSERKLIMIKGYQGWAGRALTILSSFRLIKNDLKNFHIKIFSNPDGNDIKIYADLLVAQEGLDIEILPHLDHKTMLEYFSKSRVYVGASISDGISTSFLESLATGCFPIQSNTSSANEWATHATSALFFNPEDPKEIANCIKIALLDNNLVNNAASINWETTKKRLNQDDLKILTNQNYLNILYNKN